ncbi:MAG: alpha/beta fold hydrolase [Bacteriovoracia bacterium]
MKNPIWILAGFLGDESQLGAFPSDLAKHTGVIPEVIDWKKITDGAKSLDEGARFLAQFALSCGTRPVLVGYSMGGRLSLASVLAAPGAFSGAVAISAHPGLSSEEEKAQRLKDDLVWSELLTDNQAVFWKRWLAQPVFAGSSEAQVNLSTEEAHQWAKVLRAFSTGGQDYMPALLDDPRLPPILSVVGSRDEKYLTLQKRYPQKVEKMIIDGGHRLPLDASHALAQAIAPFIRKTQEIL